MTDTEREDAMLAHAQRQTKALENINWVLMAFFVVALIALVIWVITGIS